MKILIMGLPGSGKTTLSDALKSRIRAEHINADEVRRTINKHLTFSPEDRIIQAETMKRLSDEIVESGKDCIIDFICPTAETRDAFDWKSSFVVFVNRIDSGRFEDTNMLFELPDNKDCHVIVYDDGHSAEDWADVIVRSLDVRYKYHFNSQDPV